MERGVVIGGVLISASFLFAVLLNNCAGDNVAPVSDAGAQAASDAPVATPAHGNQPVVRDNPGFYVGEAGLTPSERAGREIWYKATAGNSRFHTYTFQQRIGVLIDWYRVLRTATSATIASPHGASSTILDAACPAAAIVRRKAPDETYGFDWCPGDEQLLQYRRPAGVSRSGLRFSRRASRHEGCPSPHAGSAAVSMRPGFWYVDRRARLPQVSQSAVRSRTLAGGQWHARDLAGVRQETFRRQGQQRLDRQSPVGRLDRAAIPDRHLVRLVSHRLRSAESAGGCGQSTVVEHQGRDRAISTRASRRFSAPA